VRDIGPHRRRRLEGGISVHNPCPILEGEDISARAERTSYNSRKFTCYDGLIRNRITSFGRINQINAHPAEVLPTRAADACAGATSGRSASRTDS